MECAVKADPSESDYTDADTYQELRIGQLAQKVLGGMLRDGYASEEEIKAMQTAEYSKQNFHLQYPLLREDTGEERPIHYYKNPIEIKALRQIRRAKIGTRLLPEKEKTCITSRILVT